MIGWRPGMSKKHAPKPKAKPMRDDEAAEMRNGTQNDQEEMDEGEMPQRPMPMMQPKMGGSNFQKLNAMKKGMAQRR